MFTGQIVPESGIYLVIHKGHRLPHEVTLLKGQLFPRCAKCAELVEFEAVQTVAQLSERRGAVILYELPVLDSDDGDAATATA